MLRICLDFSSWAAICGLVLKMSDKADHACWTVNNKSYICCTFVFLALLILPPLTHPCFYLSTLGLKSSQTMSISLFGQAASLNATVRGQKTAPALFGCYYNLTVIWEWWDKSLAIMVQTRQTHTMLSLLAGILSFSHVSCNIVVLLCIIILLQWTIVQIVLGKVIF